MGSHGYRGISHAYAVKSNFAHRPGRLRPSLTLGIHRVIRENNNNRQTGITYFPVLLCDMYCLYIAC